jgi:secreted PhoX family phosphatase
MTSKRSMRGGAGPDGADDDEDMVVNDSAGATIGDLVAERLNRRDLIKGALASTVLAAALPECFVGATPAEAQTAKSAFSFKEVQAGVDGTHYVAEGYDADILIRWGDPVTAQAAAFEPRNQSGASQSKQFGYNNDFLGYFPIEGSLRGLLAVNHEYTSTELLFPGLKTVADARSGNSSRISKTMCEVEMAAHGGSVIEIVRDRSGKWSVVPSSKYGRRITLDTPMDLTGPAAGHDRMKTSADPTGRRVLGMMNNCAGGTTPWGTWLTCEENVNNYFLGPVPENHRESVNWKRIGIPGRRYAWGNYFDRFKVEKEPNESNRFGWVVEIDPFDSESIPKKRTALGRFKHEGAAGITNPVGGQYVVYSGDDQVNDYCYRFVTSAKVDTENKAANTDILDAGVLSVAKFNADGTMAWLPLVFGQGPLTPANDFTSQADVLTETRRAADLLGATARPAGRRRGKSEDRPSLRDTDQESDAKARASRCRQSARGQQARTHPRAHPAERRPFRRAISVGNSGAVRRSLRRGDRSHLQSIDQQGRLVLEPGQLRLRRDGPALDLHRRQRRRLQRSQRRPLGGRYGRPGARDVQTLLPMPRRRRNVRPLFHAGPADAIRRCPASGGGRQGMESVGQGFHIR